jgi:gluconokinase
MTTALVIDLGTTNLKVGLVDESFEVINVRSVPLSFLNKTFGEVEHDPIELIIQITTLCKELLAESGINHIDYIVSSTYQFGLMLLDKDKKPLTGISVLSDIRSQETFNGFKNLYQDIDIYERTGCPLLTPYQLPRLYYFSKKEEAVFKKAKFFADSKAFLFEWLTGEFVTDISTAAATQHYNLKSFCWDEELLSRINLSENQFPEIKDGTSYLSVIKEDVRIQLGIKNKAKVLLGVYDGAALVIGLGALKPQVGVINVGTSAMLRLPSAYPAFDKDDNKRIQPYALNKNIFLNGGALNNAALPLNWLNKNLFEIDLQNPAMLQIDNQPPLFCLPYLTSERDSKSGPYASGVYFGLRQYHTKIDLLRATMEGVAYSMRYICDALKDNGLLINELRMGGGGVHIKNWPQIFANILGHEINIPKGDQMALVGSAMLAFVADGLYKDITTLGTQIIQPGTNIKPDEKVRHIHDDRYVFFKKLRETLSTLYLEHSTLFK